MQQKRSIAQHLRTDLGRSVEATTVIQSVWLTYGLKAQPSHFPQRLCNQKDKHIYLTSYLYKNVMHVFQ